MKKHQIKASLLRTLMLFVIFLIVGLLAGGFYYAQGWLGDFAASSNINSPQQTTNTLNPTDLIQLKNEISSQQITVSKAAGIVTSKQGYNSKIQKDLNKYASIIGITIKNYGSVQPPTVGETTPLFTNGVQASFVKITLENPVSYTNLIKFMKAIETNLPKMKLTGINLSRAGSGDSVTVDPLIIEVYTR